MVDLRKKRVRFIFFLSESFLMNANKLKILVNLIHISPAYNYLEYLIIRLMHAKAINSVRVLDLW